MKYSRSLVATLLMSGGLLQLAPAVLADGTAAGQAIENTATATYSDGTNTIDATSNKVTVTVAIVAGIDVSAAGIVNITAPGTSVKVADELYYNYTITNIGNSPTAFHVPGNPSVTGPGSVTKVEYYDPAVTTNGGWVTVNALVGSNTPLIPVNGSVPVRVTIVANNTGTNNNVISVQLGNTPNNLPNQPLSASGANDDVNTTGGNPANGPRESSATQQTSIGAIVTNMALASVSEKLTGVSDGGTPANLSDDVLTYELGLKVADTDVSNSGITPAPLAGTAIQLDTGTGATAQTRILVSSAIPAGTTFVTGVSNISAPTGWTAVYSTTVGGNANAAIWSTVVPGDPTLITRIGFINNPATVTTVAPGASVAGLTFKVRQTATTGITYTVNSMAQLFGATDSTDTTIKAIVVYDESGDTTVNNGLLTQTVPTIIPGIADVNYDIDFANDNTGTGVAGEINQYIYNYTTSALFNGPSGAPTATGPNASNVISDNFDFTNKSAIVPAGLAPTATFNPDAVGFFNTVQNTGTTAATIKLLPEGTAGLPIGTEVKIYTTGANSQSATYIVTAAGFNFTSGTGGTTGLIPVSIPNVAPGASGQYQVEVNLPATLATDLIPTTAAKAFPVVINAFTGGTVAVAPGGEVSVTGTTASNKTIDKVYTGFIKMEKKTRILPGSGPAVVAADASFSTASKTPAQGNIIEYQITYENISDKLVGTGNVILNATGLVITEDGTTTNTWGQDKDSNGIIDTSNVVGFSVGSAGSVTRFNGPAGNVSSIDQAGTTATSDVTKYINSLTTVVAPGDQGTFTFQRKLN
jgi:hypothetical protein